MVILPDILKKGSISINSIHKRHAIFIESADDINYNGKNSWGTKWPDIKIPVSDTKIVEVNVTQEIIKDCCGCIMKT